MPPNPPPSTTTRFMDLFLDESRSEPDAGMHEPTIDEVCGCCPIGCLVGGQPDPQMGDLGWLGYVAKWNGGVKAGFLLRVGKRRGINGCVDRAWSDVDNGDTVGRQFNPCGAR